MTDTPDNALTPASASPQASGGGMSVPPMTDVSASSFDGGGSNEQDPLKVLLQASAAAESLQIRFSELQNRQAEIVSERNQLGADRMAFESRAKEFVEQVARDRADQREMTADLEQRQQQLKQTQADLDQQRQLLSDQREELDAKRERLHEAVNDELARERGIMQRQREEIEEERRQIIERTRQLEEEHVDRQELVEQTLQTEREEMRETIRRELAAEVEELHRERQEWGVVKDRESLEVQQQTEDLQQQRELFGEQLESEQQRLREEIEKRRQILLTEQNNLQRRYRFQFEHLGRAREDFEVELRELRKEQQLFRSERSSFSEQHQLRFSQLDKIRTTLIQRDSSMKREQKVIDRDRVSAELEIRRQHERLQEHRDSVAQDLDSRSRQLQQAEQASAETAQKVEQRLQHVTQMRTELDLQQREILEQRLLLEELQAAVRQKEAPKRGSDGYVTAQTAVEQFFDKLHQPLRAERDRMETKFTELVARQEQFRKDREELEQWFATQETTLADKSKDDSAMTAMQIASLEGELADTRRQWHSDRKESEATIRQLLDEISKAESMAFHKPAPSVEHDLDDQRSAA